MSAAGAAALDIPFASPAASSRPVDAASRARSAALRALEERRRELGLSRVELARRISISERHLIRVLNGQHPGSADLLGRLEAALEEGESRKSCHDTVARAASPALSPEKIIWAACVGLAGELAAVPPTAVAARDPQRTRRGNRATREERAASRAWEIALYLAVTACGIGQARVAKIAGVDKAQVCRAAQAVEARRDDAGFDAALTRAEAVLCGDPNKGPRP